MSGVLCPVIWRISVWFGPVSRSTQFIEPKKLNNLKINVGWRLSMKARGWKCRHRIFLFVVQNITTVNPYKTCSQARVEMVEHGNRDQMTLSNFKN